MTKKSNTIIGLIFLILIIFILIIVSNYQKNKVIDGQLENNLSQTIEQDSIEEINDNLEKIDLNETENEKEDMDTIDQELEKL